MSAAAAETRTESAPAGLGTGAAVALYTSAILGAGVLVLPAEAATIAGPASLAAWLVAALMGIPLAFVFAALSSRFPDAGGIATYTRMGIGPRAGAVVGWWYFVAGSVGQTAVTLTAGHFLASVFQLDQRWSAAFAGVLLALGVAANLLGLRAWSGLQIALAVGAVAIGVLMVALVPFAGWTLVVPVVIAGSVLVLVWPRAREGRR